VQQFTNNYNSS
jgi:hypothetical protein